MYRMSPQSSRLEGWSCAAPSLPVQFYVSALIQIHTAWELTPPPVCVYVCACVHVCECGYEGPIRHLFVSTASQTPIHFQRVHFDASECLRANVLHASMYLWCVIHSVFHMKLFLINQFMEGQLYEPRLASTPSK